MSRSPNFKNFLIAFFMSCSVISPILYKKSIFNRIKKFWFFVFEYFSNIICFIAYLVTATILLETYLEFDFSCILSFFIFLLQTYYNIYLKHIPFFFSDNPWYLSQAIFVASLFSLYNTVCFSLGTFLYLFNDYLYFSVVVCSIIFHH